MPHAKNTENKMERVEDFLAVKGRGMAQKEVGIFLRYGYVSLATLERVERHHNQNLQAR